MFSWALGRCSLFPHRASSLVGKDPGSLARRSVCPGMCPLEMLGWQRIPTATLSLCHYSIDREDWWAAVHGVIKSETWLSMQARTQTVTVSLWNSSPWLVLMEPTTPMTVWQTGFRLGHQLESLGSSYLEHWVQKKSEAKSRFSGKECRSRLVMAYSLYFSTSSLF